MAINDYLAYYKLENNYVDESGSYTLDTIVNGGFGEDRLGIANNCYESLTEITEDDRAEYSGNMTGANEKGSVSLWFKSTATQDTTSLLFSYGDTTSGNMRALGLSSSNTLNFDSYNTQAPLSSIILKQDVWYHAVVIWDSVIDTIKLYLNGGYINTISLSMGDTGSFFAIGNIFGGNSNNNHFRGNLKNIRVYDRILTNTDIQEIIYQESDIETDLLSYYKMDAGSPLLDEQGSEDLVSTVGYINSTGYIDNGNFVDSSLGEYLSTSFRTRLTDTGEYTVGGWFYIDPTETYANSWIMSLGNTPNDNNPDLGIRVTTTGVSGGVLITIFTNGGYFFDTLYAKPGWNFIAWSFNNNIGLRTFILNGAVVVISRSVPINLGFLYLGSIYSHPKKIGLDEFKIWDRALHVVDMMAEYTRTYKIDDCKFWWKLDNDYLDSSGNDNTLIPLNGSFTDDRDGNSLAAWLGDGTAYMISTDNLGVEGVTSRTISCWIKSNQIGWQSIFGIGDGTTTNGSIGLGIDATKELTIISSPSVVLGNTGYFLDDDLWHHLILRINKNARTTVEIDIIVDGELVYRYTTSSVNIVDSKLYISRFIGIDTYKREGEVDDLRVYDYNISDSQVSELYTGINISVPPVPVDPIDPVLPIEDPKIEPSSGESVKVLFDGSNLGNTHRNEHWLVDIKEKYTTYKVDYLGDTIVKRKLSGLEMNMTASLLVDPDNFLLLGTSYEKVTDDYNMTLDNLGNGAKTGTVTVTGLNDGYNLEFEGEVQLNEVYDYNPEGKIKINVTISATPDINNVMLKKIKR